MLDMPLIKRLILAIPLILRLLYGFVIDIVTLVECAFLQSHKMIYGETRYSEVYLHRKRTCTAAAGHVKPHN